VVDKTFHCQQTINYASGKLYDLHFAIDFPATATLLNASITPRTKITENYVINVTETDTPCQLTMAIINEFLTNLSHELDDEQQLNELVEWLKSKVCIIDAAVLCQSCVETDPPISVMLISFEENGIMKKFILDVSMTKPLNAVAYSECEEFVEQSNCKDELFYYSRDEKRFIDFRNDYLLIGYLQHVEDEKMINIINQTGIFKPVIIDHIRHASNEEYSLMLVNTKEQKSCSQLKEIIFLLEKATNVAFVNLVFEGLFCLGFDCRELTALTDEFLVMVRDRNNLSDLYAIVQETNTRIKYQNEFMPHWFCISADKNSKGNALQMANYFYETGMFVATEPNFRHGLIRK